MWLLYGILLILLLLCLQPLSILKRWAAALSSRWDWYVSILKKSLLLCCRFCFCLLICLPLFGTRSVFAQTETPIFGTNTPIPPTLTPLPLGTTWPTNEPTLTPTFHPLFPTSTPRPPGDNTCPGYQPIGAGTVTPGTAWLLKCDKCITPIPRYTWPTVPALPTLDPIVFGTSTPSGTSTPNATATANPLGTLTVKGIYNSYENDVILPNVMISRNVIKNNNSGGPNWGFVVRTNSSLPVSFGVHEIGNITLTATQFEVHTFFLKWFVSNNISGGADIEVISSNVVSLPVGTLLHINKNITNSLSLFDAPVNSTIIRNWDIKYNVTLLGTNANTSQVAFKWFYSDDAYFGSYNVHTESEWSGDPYTGAVPPIISDCSTIPVQPINDPNDPNFKLPYIGVGEGSCTGIPAITIGTSWLQLFFSSAPDSLSFGGVQFCFAPISFGSLNIFGIPIDLDLMAMVMAGVLMFKVITR